MGAHLHVTRTELEREVRYNQSSLGNKERFVLFCGWLTDHALEGGIQLFKQRMN